MEFDYRQFRETDIDNLNALYEAVTGRKRSKQAFQWQWLDAPGGRGEIWIIEVARENQEKKLIGHHGLMPLVFDDGEQTYIAGKTENTMVHPDYRRKLLYPRFERRFLKHYQERFDLLFSTMGPVAAIRQRKSLGYDTNQEFVRFDLQLRLGAPIVRIGGGLVRSNSSRTSTTRKLAGQLMQSTGRTLGYLGKFAQGQSSKSLRVFTDDEARSHNFFDTFWNKARQHYPLTPRRNKEDLDWRYWNNPITAYVTLVSEESNSIQGYAILRRENHLVYTLEDIVCMPYSEQDFIGFLKTVCGWCANDGASVLSFTTTSDVGSVAQYISDSDIVCVNRKWPLSRRKKVEMPMLRKVTERGESSGAQTDNWYVTPLIFEGRA